MSTLAGFNGQSRMPDACQVPRSPSLASFSSLLCMCTVYVRVCVYMYVSMYLTLERKNPRKQLLFSFCTSLSSCHCISPPPFPSSTRRISRLSSSIRGHFRTRRHVRSSVFFFSLFFSSARRLVPPPDTFAVSSWFFRSRIRQYPYNMGHRTPRDLVAARHSLG